MIHFKGVDLDILGFDAEMVGRWVEQTILMEEQKAGEVFFLFTTDDYLLGINKTFLDHDYYTDIVTFDTSIKSGIISGELYISLDRVADNAKREEVDFLEELFRVMIHGILHLCGYGDKTQNEIEIMRDKENIYLSQLFKSS
jgi:probable rRNA maturation factor